jgi:hypothetical protein
MLRGWFQRKDWPFSSYGHFNAIINRRAGHYTGRRAVALVRKVLHNRRHGHSIQHSPFISSSALSMSSVSETTYRPAYSPQIIYLAEIWNKRRNDQFVEKHSSIIVRSERYSLLAGNLTVDHKRRKPVIKNEQVYSIKRPESFMRFSLILSSFKMYYFYYTILIIFCT